MPGTVQLLDPQGVARDVPADIADAAIERGWKPQTQADVLQQAGAAAHEADYGGVGGAVKATLAAGARGATLGLSDVAARVLGGDEAADSLRGLQSENPKLSFAGELAGAIAPTLLSGGANLPSNLAARAGRGVAEGLGGGLLAKAAGAAGEGALYGLGSGVSELALSQDPLTWERAASTLSSHTLYGAALGGGAGLAGGLLEHGLGAAKKAIDARLEQHALETTAAAGGSVDLATAISNGDRKALDSLRTTELDSIKAAAAPERKALVDDLETFYQANRDTRFSTITRGADDANARGASAALRVADMRMRKLFDLKGALVEDPAPLLKHLESQGEQLEKLTAWGQQQESLFQKARRDAPAQVRDAIISGKVEGEVASAMTPAGLDLAVEREITRRLKEPWEPGARMHEGGVAVPSSRLRGDGLDRPDEVFDKIRQLPDALQANRDLIERLKTSIAPPTSERLTAIEAAKEAMAAKHEPSLGERLLHRVPGASLVGEIAGLGGKTIGSLRAAVGKAAIRTGEAVSAFAGKAIPAVGKATPLATRVLSEVSYAPRAVDAAAGVASTAAPAPAKADLPALFKARTDEIKSQTAYDEHGIPRIRPEARQAIASRLQPVRVADPVLGDRLETLAVRRLEYLSSLIPRRPDFGGLQQGPDNWRPSGMEMRTFARSVAAAENPDAVEERIAHGSVTPEDAAAYWAIYPERAKHFQQQVMQAMPTAYRLPYSRRLALGLFSGRPVDPSMHPRVFAVLQGQFADEPGSAGGTQAPKANPQFGAITKSVDAPTAAQARSQGVRI